MLGSECGQFCGVGACLRFFALTEQEAVRSHWHLPCRRSESHQFSEAERNEMEQWPVATLFLLFVVTGLLRNGVKSERRKSWGVSRSLRIGTLAGKGHEFCGAGSFWSRSS